MEHDNVGGKIYLSGGGNGVDSFLLDKEFVDRLGERKILYIPIAMDEDIVGFKACRSWLVSTLSAHKKDLDITMWLDLEHKKLSDLAEFGAIYIGGGNTYKLLQTLHETEMIKTLKEFLLSGKIIYGGSAGAIIMGKNISTSSEENDNNYKFENGLSLLGDYSLVCHYGEEEDSKILEYIEKYKNPVIALSEKNGLIVENNKAQVIGYEPVVIFKDGAKTKVAPNEFFSLQ